MKQPLYVLMALDRSANPRQASLIRKLRAVRCWEVVVVAPLEVAKISDNGLVDLAVPAVDSTLWDFSRYASLLEAAPSDAKVVAFNDTFGKGRHLGLSVSAFIIIALFLIDQKRIKLAAPVDSDQFGQWICPYFLVSTAGFLKGLNWIDHERAQSQLPAAVLLRCQSWIETGWRHASTATTVQRAIKLRTLYLERRLIDFPMNGLMMFSRRNLFRMLNRWL